MVAHFSCLMKDNNSKALRINQTWLFGNGNNRRKFKYLVNVQDSAFLHVVIPATDTENFMFLVEVVPLNRPCPESLINIGEN